MSHFLLIYDRAHSRAPRVKRFDDAEEALEHLRQAERTLGRAEGAVLLVADDEDDLRLTHGHYFTSLDDLLAAS